MADEFLIDGHKLMYHPREVAAWMAGKEIFPLYVEISPSGACNHRCVFCAFDYREYKPRFLDAGMLRCRIEEMASLGIKSVMFGGEGEPLLHRDICDLVNHAKANSIDVALTTNGVLLTSELSGRIVPSASWIKVSLNAGTAETYAALHRTRADDFERVWRNIGGAAAVIARTNARCMLGVQAILLPENAAEMELLAERAKEAGAAYLVVKTYSQHQHSMTRQYADLDYSPWMDLAERLDRFANDGFRVIVRTRSMKKLQRQEWLYERCLSLPFWTYIDTDGNVWGCSAHLGDERFLYGSLYEQDFASIWRGERRIRSLAMVAKGLDPRTCRNNCRMDEVNRYLWELTHPPEHVNFI